MEFEDLSGYDYSNLSPYEDILNFDQKVSEPFTTQRKVIQEQLSEESIQEEESYPIVILNSNNNGRWGLETTWVDNYGAITDNVIDRGTEVNVHHNVRINTSETIINNGVINLEENSILVLNTTLINNGRIILNKNSELRINPNTKLVNIGSIVIHPNSELILNGILINKNLEHDSLMNNGSLKSRQPPCKTKNNAIYYYYSSVPRTNHTISGTGSVSNITQISTNERLLNIESLNIESDKIIDSLETVLLIKLIEGDDNSIRDFLIRTNDSGLTPLDQAKDNHWSILNTDTFFEAERKEVRSIVGNSLKRTGKIYLDSQEAINLVNSLKTLENINESSTVFKLANQTGDIILDTSLLSTDMSVITLNTSKLRTYLQELDRQLQLRDNNRRAEYNKYNRSTIGDKRDISELSCLGISKECIVSKLFHKLTYEQKLIVDTLEKINRILNKYIRVTLFTKAHYNELEHILAYSQGIKNQINTLLNVWNFILNIKPEDEEWDVFSSSKKIEDVWFNIVNLDGNYSFKLNYRVNMIHNNENKITTALADSMLSDYLPYMAAPIKNILYTYGKVINVSRDMCANTTYLLNLNEQYIEEEKISRQKTLALPDGLLLSKLGKKNSRCDTLVEEEIVSEEEMLLKTPLFLYIFQKYYLVILAILTALCFGTLIINKYNLLRTF